MKKLKKLIIIAIILIVIAIALIYTYKMQQMIAFIQKKESRDKSVIIINNIVLDRTLDSGAKIKIKAKKAYLNKDTQNLESLEDCSIEYKTENVDIYASADKCTYIENKEVTLRNNIKGSINNKGEFWGGENSTYDFDINKGIGVMKGDIKMTWPHHRKKTN